MQDRKTPLLSRLAIQVVNMLPDNTGDALAVLDLARELLTKFVDPASSGGTNNGNGLGNGNGNGSSSEAGGSGGPPQVLPFIRR